MHCLDFEQLTIRVTLCWTAHPPQEYGVHVLAMMNVLPRVLTTYLLTNVRTYVPVAEVVMVAPAVEGRAVLA